MGKYRLFEGYGIEIEYMIVNRDTMKVSPVADILLEKLAGEPTNECFIDGIGYSNELVKHVIEVKTDGPAQYDGLSDKFYGAVQKINGLLEELNCMIMPTAMHPLMNPMTETELWKEENAEIYDAYDRIFNCKGHGWSNLQSIHINLPFNGDKEFAKLHAAIRCVLPLIPALCASSPIVEGEVTGYSDNRLEFYRKNQRSVPQVAGFVIPEPVFSEKDYNEKIFDVLQTAIAPHDPEGILEPIWLNSRGAIARFDRGAIEIRLIDVQECPMADVAVAKLVSETVKYLCKYGDMKKMMALDEKAMYNILLETITKAEEAVISDENLLSIFNIEGNIKAYDIWDKMFIRTKMNNDTAYAEPLRNIFLNGTLATRITKSLHKGIGEVYAELSHCLSENKLYHG